MHPRSHSLWAHRLARAAWSLTNSGSCSCRTIETGFSLAHQVYARKFCWGALRFYQKNQISLTDARNDRSWKSWAHVTQAIVRKMDDINSVRHYSWDPRDRIASSELGASAEHYTGFMRTIDITNDVVLLLRRCRWDATLEAYGEN